MAITIDAYSTEMTDVIQSQTQGWNPLDPNKAGGRLERRYFSYTVPTAGLTDGSNIIACIIPKGARCLGGKLVPTGTGTSTQDVDVGVMGRDGSGFIDAAGSVADDDDFFVAAADVGGTATVNFGLTAALNYAYVTEKELYLVLTVETTALIAANVIEGHIDFVVI